ncbi:SIR2 family protein [Microbacterium sp. Bi121]|uniref:SIR2 family NAD-dependent protein deacylase n=1 Tax=Microbacterium sp. Bi121 TaxID=2822348 RepID=UPI001E1806A1|nr:SIR2 family protein [Microbacterium sp. Bi121]CAH0123307.1 hypothetical protein SRABI121_00486 [Microbacterium sp. Bi121]
MTGHVFVIQGDTRRFACDAYLHATDRELRPGGGWTRSAPEAPTRLDPQYEREFRSEARYTLPLLERADVPDEPTTILTAVPYHRVKTADQIVPRLEEFFSVAAEVVAHRQPTKSLSNRSKPLLAVPLFGAGGGGGGKFRGELLRVIDERSRIAAQRYDVDVAIVLRDPQAYALAQMTRRDDRERWPELTDEMRDAARRLGEVARDARLVPFMGSGISMSAGAPDWTGLIRTLAQAAGLDEDVVELLVNKHDVLDQAAFVRDAFARDDEDGRDRFTETIVEAVDKRRYGLLPPLLAALEAEQAITLNYDQLFEWAAFDGQRPRRVIPGAAETSNRWLLKLHGSVDRRESIVLTREDYLGFNADRAALSSLVKATLMTRHLLFVGFGMGDAHFHEIVHDVRRALPERGHRFGTVVTLSDDQVTRRLWENDLDFVHIDSPRQLEIFLDAMLAYGATSNSYLLADGYESALDGAELEVRRALMAVTESVSARGRNGKSWPVVARMLEELGFGSETPA